MKSILLETFNVYFTTSVPLNGTASPPKACKTLASATTYASMTSYLYMAHLLRSKYTHVIATVQLVYDQLLVLLETYLWLPPPYLLWLGRPALTCASIL